MSRREITDRRRVLTQKSTVAVGSAAKEAEAKAKKKAEREARKKAKKKARENAEEEGVKGTAGKPPWSQAATGLPGSNQSTRFVYFIPSLQRPTDNSAVFHMKKGERFLLVQPQGTLLDQQKPRLDLRQRWLLLLR